MPSIADAQASVNTAKFAHKSALRVFEALPRESKRSESGTAAFKRVLETLDERNRAIEVLILALEGADKFSDAVRHADTLIRDHIASREMLLLLAEDAGAVVPRVDEGEVAEAQRILAHYSRDTAQELWNLLNAAKLPAAQFERLADECSLASPNPNQTGAAPAVVDAPLAQAPDSKLRLPASPSPQLPKLRDRKPSGTAPVGTDKPVVVADPPLTPGPVASDRGDKEREPRRVNWALVAVGAAVCALAAFAIYRAFPPKETCTPASAAPCVFLECIARFREVQSDVRAALIAGAKEGELSATKRVWFAEVFRRWMRQRSLRSLRLARTLRNSSPVYCLH